MDFNTTLERIIGGKDVESHIPWQVSIQRYNVKPNTWTHFCGGTILNQYTILTAAHCFYSGYWRKGIQTEYIERLRPELYRIVAGTPFHQPTESQSHVQVLNLSNC